jgi:hypothetical protein
VAAGAKKRDDKTKGDDNKRDGKNKKTKKGSEKQDKGEFSMKRIQQLEHTIILLQQKMKELVSPVCCAMCCTCVV